MTFTHKKAVNIYIEYEINLWSYTWASLFGAVKLTKNTDTDKYPYLGYCVGFDGRGLFLLSGGSGFGKNVIIFGAYGSSSVHIDNK